MDKSQATINPDLKYKSNPRKITRSQQEQLKDHLQKYGDLGGVIFCRNNKAYVGGNQRSSIFQGAKIDYIQTYTEPQPDKTVALGLIEWNSNKYMYREVDFTEQEFREACIAANNDGGNWDLEVFKEAWTKEELEAFGFNTSEFDNLFPDQEDLSIANGSFEPTTSIEYMKFSGYRIPLSDIELAGLNRKADDYFSLNGTLLGFAQTLV